MEEKEFNTMNVIPLVDIMLVLLTIVLTTATFIAQGNLPIKLPQAKQSVSILEEKSYRITLKEDGEIFFENRHLDHDQLKEVLGAINPSSQIVIYSDKKAKVQDLVKILDMLQELNLKKVYLKTELIK
jgi:biopolymer transport protein ExbD